MKDKGERDFRLVSGSADDRGHLDFNMMKVGGKTLSNDVTMDTERLEKLAYRLGGHRKVDQKMVRDWLLHDDVRALRALSRVWFNTSGIYNRLVRYMAALYRYDWTVIPEMYDQNLVKEGATQTPAQKKVVSAWYDVSRYLERSNLKRTFHDIALKVVRDGCFYGYRVENSSAAYLQELPIEYCRSRYELNGQPAVEFNVRFFDEKFPDVEYRARVLRMFPDEVRQAYVRYKNDTLEKDFKSDERGWVLLEPSMTIRFTIGGSDAPLFAAVIPKLMDLEDAQGLDKKRMMQQIIKILVQKFPLDKNGDLIFDTNEMQQLHSNAVTMLQDAIGVDVLSTVADVDIEDMADNSKTTTIDQLEKAERAVYNEAGTGQNLFNSDGNLSLQYSISNDEATMTSLVLRFEEYVQSIVDRHGRNLRNVRFVAHILPTTVYNYQDLATQYKEMTAIGFSKLLPQVALGQSQSSVIMTAYFENNLLHLNDIFVPPASSATTSGNSDGATSEKVVESQDEGGRPALDDDDKTDKTISNQSSE